MMNRRQYLKYGIAGASSLLLGNAVASESEYLWDFDYLSTPYTWRYSKINFDCNLKIVSDVTSKKIPTYYVMLKYNPSYSTHIAGRQLHACDGKSFYNNSNKPNVEYFKKAFSEYRQQETAFYKEYYSSGKLKIINADNGSLQSIDYYFALQTDKNSYRVITDECVLTDTISHKTVWDRNNEFWKPLFRRTI